MQGCLSLQWETAIPWSVHRRSGRGRIRGGRSNAWGKDTEPDCAVFLAYFPLMMEPWHWWALIVLVLLIGEAFVPGLVLGSLAVGALAGGLASLVTDWWEYQFVAASAGAVLSLLFLRPLAMRKWFSGESVGTGIDALPGRSVRVTVPFDPQTGRGRGLSAGRMAP